ncbi:hypothetical protein H4Q26_007141 [Puccinia striiformis f. sp. tritici PST-130]|nr:hypothetical protein H4Q26_007141 [Puccinia striiformis f. sp. tritici PST-130]
MLQSLSDSLNVKAQAILDNFDPEKLTKINSFFNNCLGKISNFALQKAHTTLLKLVNLYPPPPAAILTQKGPAYLANFGLWKFWNLACWLSQSILILNGI